MPSFWAFYAAFRRGAAEHGPYSKRSRPAQFGCQLPIYLAEKSYEYVEK